MTTKTVTNEKYHQFQVIYMSNPGLKIGKEFREQVESNLALTFDYEKNISIRKVSKKENTLVISFIMFYENRKNIVLNVLRLVVYCIMENYLCADHLCCQHDELNLSNKGFEKTIFNDISGILIP